MASESVTPDNIVSIGHAAPATKARKPPKLADQIHQLQHSVHVTFCTLEAATAALEKAENEDDADLWIRAARVVERCRDELDEIRETVDGLDVCAEVPHG